MTLFHENRDIFIGLFIILCSLVIIIFPPRFGNAFYGIHTKWTMKNESAWKTGQKLFAFSSIGIGIVFVSLGTLKIHEEIPSFAMFGLLIGLWKTSQYLVHKTLSNKYSGNF